MVHFEPGNEEDELTEADLAPVTYLHGSGPGMKRRSPLEVVPADAPVQATDDDNDDDDDENDAQDNDVDSEAGGLDEQEHAEKVLLHRLRGRSLSTAEALLVLNGMGIPSGDTSEIIEKFTQLGYLDEVKLAEQIMHSHNVRKGLGRQGVETEMRRRKLDVGVMLDKLEELPDDEAERAIDLATKRISQLERFDDQTIDRRLTGFLMRKGYSSTAVRLAVRSAMDGRGGGTSGVRFR